MGRSSRAGKRDFSAIFSLREGGHLLETPRRQFVSTSTQTQNRMAKALSKSQIAAALAEKVGITKKQAVLALDTLAEMSYKNAKNGFTFPGVGKLVLVNRKARMGRNPKTGEPIKIPARKAVKFRVSKAAKVAILGG